MDFFLLLKYLKVTNIRKYIKCYYWTQNGCWKGPTSTSLVFMVD